MHGLIDRVGDLFGGLARNPRHPLMVEPVGAIAELEVLGVHLRRPGVGVLGVEVELGVVGLEPECLEVGSGLGLGHVANIHRIGGRMGL